MKTKHTFGFLFIFGIVWTGILFAYSSGPPSAVNGVLGATAQNTCAQSGCHSDFPLNSGTGSVVITGLPATWTPGQVYALTVRVSLTGAQRYGFQFTSVSNSTGAQAGTLSAASPADARVQICPGGPGCFNDSPLQFAEHNSFANTSGTFNFRWTAPSSAAVGAVRFNVAGNAANGDANSTGDRIYTASAIVSPGVVDSTPPVISALTASSITTSTASISWTTDEPADTQVEFGLTASYGQSTTLDTSLGNAHAASLVGLQSSTTYHYRVKSRDAASNLATSGDQTFITPFLVSNLSGVSRITDGTGPLVSGYGRIQTTSGTTPSGIGIFGYRQSGILVSEAGVPDSPLITAGRTYAEVSSNLVVNTGLAIANPNPTAATIAFTIRDTSGATIKSGSTIIPANQHLARFLDQDPYQSGTGFQGTFSFTSTVPVSVVALRGFFNERSPSEFLITTLPVLDLASSGGSGTQVIPHFAAGDGWTTQIVLLNPTSTDQTGTLQFLDQGSGSTAGAPKTVNIDGTAGSSRAYTVKANSSQKLVITGAAPGTASGSVRVVPTAGGPVPTPLVIFSYKPATITVSEAGVPVTMGTTFRMFAQLSSSPQILSGIAIANATATQGTVTLSLTSLDGLTTLGTSAPQVLPASGQIVGFLDQLIPSVAGQTVQGILRITTTVSSISVVGLRARYNERQPTADFLITTTPPTLETGAPSTAERLFPHLANGGGYTTQFILFSGTAGQTSGGTLSFVNSDGTPMDLNIN